MARTSPAMTCWRSSAPTFRMRRFARRDDAMNQLALTPEKRNCSFSFSVSMVYCTRCSRRDANGGEGRVIGLGPEGKDGARSGAGKKEGESFCPYRRRNQLRTLNYEKLIQGNQSFFL